MLPIYIGTSKNGTTSTEEISTAKSSDATLHKSISLIYSFDVRSSIANVEYQVKYKICVS